MASRPASSMRAAPAGVTSLMPPTPKDASRLPSSFRRTTATVAPRFAAVIRAIPPTTILPSPPSWPFAADRSRGAPRARPRGRSAGFSRGIGCSTVPCRRHDRGGEARHGALPARLRPEVPLLLQCQAARLQEFGNPLPRRRRVLDAELEWLGGETDHGPCVSHEERPRLDDL